MALSNDEVLALLSKARVKGQYEESLKELLASDDVAVNPQETWPALYARKEVSSIYQGFINAKKKLNGSGESIRVIRREDTVFVINMDKVALDSDS